MADMKIDRLKFNIFLENVKKIFDFIDINILPADLQAVAADVLSYADAQLQLSELMEQRKLFYEFYKKNYIKDPDSANQMYQKYIETKEKIEKLREMECI